jgi:hypothetical protein
MGTLARLKAEKERLQNEGSRKVFVSSSTVQAFRVSSKLAAIHRLSAAETAGASIHAAAATVAADLTVLQGSSLLCMHTLSALGTELCIHACSNMVIYAHSHLLLHFK